MAFLFLSGLILASSVTAGAAQVSLSGELPIGSYVQFGEYEDKPIIWQVIHNDENGSVLFARDIVSYKAFDAKGDKVDGRDCKYNSRQEEGSNYWERSNLREWLNSREQIVAYSHQVPDCEHTIGVWYKPFGGETKEIDVSYANEPGFLSNFHDAELAAIQEMQIKTFISSIDAPVKDGGTQVWADKQNNDNAWFKYTRDKVFLLSRTELQTWLSANKLSDQAPWYTFPNGVQANTYWVRTPDPNYASTIGNMNAYRANGVRPALYLKPAYQMSGPGTSDAPYAIRFEVPVGEPIVEDKPSIWAVDDVEEAISNNLVDDKLQLRYQAEISRAEFCSLSVKLYEELSGRTALYDLVSPFADTNDIDVRKAYNLGIVQGLAYRQFAPDNNITREQMAVMFYRTLQTLADHCRSDIDLHTTHEIKFYDNNEISDWAIEAVTFMNYKKIILGTGTGFNPKGTATREQAILITNRTFEKYK